MGPHLSIFTYNVLFPQRNDGHTSEYCTKLGYSLRSDGIIQENSLQRLPLIKYNLQKANADIISLQELTHYVYDEIRKEMQEEYEFSELSLHGGGAIHGVALIWRKTKLEFVNHSIGRTYLDPYKFRAHLSVDLRDPVVKKTIRIVSCHLYHPSQFYEPLSNIAQVLKFAAANHAAKPDAVVLTGDLNSDTNYISLFRDLFLTSGFTPIDDALPTEYERVSSSFDDSSALVTTGKKLDWILIRPTDVSAKICSEPLRLDFELKASDHRPIGALIRWQT